jgi:hypothetical protein
MRRIALIAVLLGMLAEVVAAQYARDPQPRETSEQAAGAEPSAMPGAVAGQERARTVLGLPVAVALALGAVMVVALVVAGLVIPRARRRDRARGNGTYGPPV